MPTITITSDKPVVVLTVEEYQQMLDQIERMEILADPTLARDIAGARKALKEGRTTGLADLKAALLED